MQTQAESNEALRTKMGWKISNESINKLNGFHYICFSFKFEIEDKKIMT